MLNVKKLFTKILTDMKKCDKKTLLWENAASTSSFSPQDVNLTLSNYNAVEVMFSNSNGSFEGVCIKCAVGQSEIGRAMAIMNGFPNARSREFGVTTSKVSFESGRDASSNWGVANNVCIPRAIYGIKGGVLTCLNFITSLLFRERGCCVC